MGQLAQAVGASVEDLVDWTLKHYATIGEIGCLT